MPNKKLYDMLGINPAPKVATESAAAPEVISLEETISLEEIIEDAEPAPKKGKKKK